MLRRFAQRIWASQWVGGEPMSRASPALWWHRALAQFLQAWKERTPFANGTDFLFASPKAKGRVPISLAVLVSEHLWPAAKAAGLEIPEGYRFGLHNLRHSL